MKIKYLDNKDHAVIDMEKCTGCGICADICPHQLFIIQDKKALLHEAVRCIGCGACMKNCPFSAVTVKTGVGCASAVFNSILRRGGNKSADCSCEIENENESCCGTKKTPCCGTGKSTCC